MKTKKHALDFEQRLARRIRRIAREMHKLGIHMDYYGGFGEIGKHGREMIGAANMAIGWANGIGAEAAPDVKKPKNSRCK
jgi:hypothetical protein